MIGGSSVAPRRATRHSPSQWIRARGLPDRPLPSYVCFQRVFCCGRSPVRALLRIAGDSRFRVYVNGTRLLDGPARSWGSVLPLEEVEVTHLLHPGRNVLSVLLHHFGVSTTQYVYGPPRLWVELAWRENGRTQRVVSDRGWRACVHRGFATRVPRILSSQGWEEQLDARQTPMGWLDNSNPDSHWQRVEVLSETSKEVPGKALGLPAMTDEARLPVRLVASELVRPASCTHCVDPSFLWTGSDRSGDTFQVKLLLATMIHSPKPQRIEIHQPHWEIPWRLNGRDLRFTHNGLQETSVGVARARLRNGWNLLAGKPHEVFTMQRTTVNLWTRLPVKFAASTQPPERRTAASPWLLAGPFVESPDPVALHPLRIREIRYTRADDALPRGKTPDFQAIWNCRRTSELLKKFAHLLAPLPTECVADVDVYGTCASERVVSGIRPHVVSPMAVLSASTDTTVIHPDRRGDPRLTLDFGDEVNGHVEFAVTADAGAIIDLHFFEHISIDGRALLCESMQNSCRYVCRSGHQIYRTFQRRGFRYLRLSFRDLKAPLCIHRITARHCTYPQTGRGRFACSDPLLERIWHASRATLRCCSEDTYTDCPSYEQTLYPGDARMESRIDLAMNGDPRLSTRSWQLCAESLLRSPLVECRIPSGSRCILPNWSFLWMTWGRELCEWTGDPSLARSSLRWLARSIDGLRSFLDSRHLLRIAAFNFLDWAGMDSPSDGHAVVTHQNALAVKGIEDAAWVAVQRGNQAQARKWRELARNMRGAINRHLWDSSRQAYSDCLRPEGLSQVFSQQTQAACLFAEIPTGPRLDRCMGLLRKTPSDFVKAGSLFFETFKLDLLAREGNVEEMLSVIRNTWMPQLDAASTTFWEECHPERARPTRSFCHGWSASPAYFLSTCVLGVRPLTPGFGLVGVSLPTCSLRWANGTVPTPKGDVDVQWQREGAETRLKLSCTADQCVRVDVPVGSVVDVRSGERKRRSGFTAVDALVFRGGKPIDLMFVPRGTRAVSQQRTS